MYISQDTIYAHVPKTVFNHPLEDNRCIFRPQEHSFVLKQSYGGMKAVWSICLGSRDLLITSGEIKHGKNSYTQGKG